MKDLFGKKCRGIKQVKQFLLDLQGFFLEKKKSLKYISKHINLRLYHHSLMNCSMYEQTVSMRALVKVATDP